MTQLTPKTAKQILNDLHAGKVFIGTKPQLPQKRRGILEEYRAEYEASAKMTRKQVAEDNSEAAVYFRDLEKTERALNM